MNRLSKTLSIISSNFIYDYIILCNMLFIAKIGVLRITRKN